MRTLLRTLIVSLLITPLRGDVWNDSDIFIESVFHQQDSTGSYLDSATPVAFRASVRNTFSDQLQSLSLPGGSLFPSNPIADFQRIGAHHVFWSGASSFSALSQLFASGLYQWQISGSNSGGLVEPSIQSSSFSSIEFQPQIINGVWNNGRLLLSASAPSFQIAPWSGAPSGARIEFELWRQGGAGGSSMGSGSTTVSWLPQPVGSVFSAYLSFRIPEEQAQIGTPSGSVFNSRFGRASTLYFEIEMISSAVPPPGLPTLRISPGIVLSWDSHTAQHYQVWTSVDLATWFRLGTQIQGTGSEMRFFDPMFTKQKFYKLEVLASASGGLEILEARYGANETFNDVRTYIEANVVDGEVNMRVGNSTLGGDPLFGVPKSLYIHYRTKLGEFEATIPEGGTLRIPDSNHTPL